MAFLYNECLVTTLLLKVRYLWRRGYFLEKLAFPLADMVEQALISALSQSQSFNLGVKVFSDLNPVFLGLLPSAILQLSTTACSEFLYQPSEYFLIITVRNLGCN